MAPARPGAKGLALEETLRSYFWRAGYFVARGLPYRLEGEDVTDVDLWLYERPAAATRHRCIVDIKNKRSPKATERVIWTAGLRQALRVDAAIVATTDRRPATRRLARALDVAVLDGEAISKLIKSPQVVSESVLTGEEWDDLLRSVDSARGATAWRDRVRSVRSSMLSDFGVRSGNNAMGAVIFFAQAAIEAQPRSKTAEAALRAVYACAGLAAVSLDFALSDHAFSSTEDRARAISNGIRYGQADDLDALRNVRLAVGLARDFAQNGKAVARQIEGAFLQAADEIAAEIVADYVARQSSAEALFAAARTLEEASASRALVGYDDLTTAAKSMLGVLLDFGGISREALAMAGPSVLKGKAGVIKQSSAVGEVATGSPAEGASQGKNSTTPHLIDADNNRPASLFPTDTDQPS